jgi:hypothetical protein
MKKNRIPTTQNRVLRWLMSAAVLFYVLVPHVGACHCSHCNCCEHSVPQEAAEAVKPPSCCCSKELPAPQEHTEDGSKSCPCLLKGTPDIPVFVASPQILLLNVFSDGLSVDLPAMIPFLPIAVESIDSFYNPFESVTSRLPVRLHLLLLVLLN